MKKLVLIMMAVVIIVTSFAQEKRYGIESAILKKKSVIKRDMMEQIITSTHYIADYGMKESIEIVMNMQGTEVLVFSVMKDGYMYNSNMTTKQGTKTMIDSNQTVNYLNLTDEAKKKHQLEENGNEQFLGKDCKKYILNVTTQGQTVQVTMLIWQGIVLKATMNMSGNTTIEEVTEIQEGVNIQREKFELPQGINFI